MRLLFGGLRFVILFSLLTLLTQVGGLIWLACRLWYRFTNWQSNRWRRWGLYATTYLLVILFIVPQLAKIGGRASLPMWKHGGLRPHIYWTVLMNRQYVRADLKQDLTVVAERLANQFPGSRLTYLDANFPFIDGFPLLPHLSHNDGRKVDLSFFYTQHGELSNARPAFSGYGAYVVPPVRQSTKQRDCKTAGYWQYDFSKYLTFGSRQDLEFDPERTKALVLALLKQTAGSKILLEPHLRQRMGLSANRVRWQGCHSVRHDDHLHFQVP